MEHRTADGDTLGAQARIIDFDNPSNNDWLAVNQFTVTEKNNHRRPDVVLFINGLPLCITELKNPADEDATIWTAWQQLQTKKAELSNLFSMNVMLMVSDGTQARIGALTAGKEWFKPWRTIAGEILADPDTTELQVMLEGVCAPSHFLRKPSFFLISHSGLHLVSLSRWSALPALRVRQQFARETHRQDLNDCRLNFVRWP